MSWFKREDNEIVNDAAEDRPHRGPLGPLPRLQADHLQGRARQPTSTSAPSAATTSASTPATRIENLLEPGYELVDLELRSTDPLDFTDLKPYKKRLAEAQQEDRPQRRHRQRHRQPRPARRRPLSVMEYAFIGGSMGAVVGETIARAVDRSLATRHPLIIVSASGGARMMEGIASLMQLAKISAGLARLDDAGIPYISVMTDPTTGGVTASFAMLGDLNIAEPGALIGFAGPRVIEQTIRQKLPEGFQRIRVPPRARLPRRHRPPQGDEATTSPQALTWMTGKTEPEVDSIDAQPIPESAEAAQTA